MLRDELQKPNEYFDPGKIYVPVAAHETRRMFLATASAQELTLKKVDVDNAYLYSHLDVPIVMEKPTSSMQILEMSDSYCLLHMLLYGARQAGMLWGSMIHKDLKS